MPSEQSKKEEVLILKDQNRIFFDIKGNILTEVQKKKRCPQRCADLL